MLQQCWFFKQLINWTKILTMHTPFILINHRETETCTIINHPKPHSQPSKISKNTNNLEQMHLRQTITISQLLSQIVYDLCYVAVQNTCTCILRWSGN